MLLTNLIQAGKVGAKEKASFHTMHVLMTLAIIKERLKGGESNGYFFSLSVFS